MGRRRKGVLYWVPRVLGILAIAFISVFALDVFAPGIPLSEALLGLAIHLVPSAVLVVILAFAWRFELAGGVVFLLVSALPFLALSNPAQVNVMLAAPFALTGILFIASHFRRQAP